MVTPSNEREIALCIETLHGVSKTYMKKFETLDLLLQENKGYIKLYKVSTRRLLFVTM